MTWHWSISPTCFVGNESLTSNQESKERWFFFHWIYFWAKLAAPNHWCFFWLCRYDKPTPNLQTCTEIYVKINLCIFYCICQKCLSISVHLRKHENKRYPFFFWVKANSDCLVHLMQEEWPVTSKRSSFFSLGLELARTTRTSPCSLS